MNKEELILNRTLRRFKDTDINVFNNKTKLKQRAEGEIWEENNKHWKIENGTIVSVTNLDYLRKEVVIPNFCPSCKNLMKHKMDEKMYTLYKHCLSCQQEFETELKISGKYEEWENSQINKNLDSMKKDLIEEFKEYQKLDLTNNIINEDGKVSESVQNILTKEEVEVLVNEKLSILAKIRK